MMYKIIFIIFIVFINMHSNAGTIDPSVSDAKYIAYAKDFKYVGRLCGSYDDPENSRFCASAVAIDDHHILTAAHVVKGSSSCFFYLGDKEFCINEMIIHKDFDKDEFGIADIAIGYCEESFDLEFYPALYETDDEVGKVCSISGYGFHGTFKTGAHWHDNKKRAGSNVIDGVQKKMLICSPSKIGDKNRTELEFLIASGDSGGGLFIGHRLAGINSCIMAVDSSPSGKYNEESGHTRISQFVEWIKNNKKQ